MGAGAFVGAHKVYLCARFTTIFTRDGGVRQRHAAEVRRSRHRLIRAVDLSSHGSRPLVSAR